MKKKIAFYTMGCKLNYAETSTIERTFSKLDYQHVSFKEYADIYIINSCSVTKNAEIEFRKIVRTALNRNKKAFIIAIGCYAQLNYKKVSSIFGVDLVLNHEEKFRIVDWIEKKIRKQNFYKLENYSYFPSFSIGGEIRKLDQSSSRTRSFLKIQDGCDYKCSYCVIPFSRGPSRSDEMKNILRNIHFLFKNGVKEIVLTGINVGDYGKKNGKYKYTFFDLIQAIENDIKENGRIRLSSIEPNLLKKEHIKFLSKSKYFVPHFHIPLQSGSNQILGNMRRRYTRELYKKRVQDIRRLIPNSYIGSDVIVGFPGETYQKFLETYFFLKKLEISSLHVFTYSPRPNTKSFFNKNHLSQRIKKKRNHILRDLSIKKYHFFCKNQIFSKKTVLFEKYSKNKKYLYGYTENYIRTKIELNSKSILYQNTLQNVFLRKMDHKDGIMIVEPINHQ